MADKKLKVLELFAGSRSFAQAARSQGHTAFTSDITDFGGIDYVADILDFDPTKIPFIPDVIWASPPCTGFSVAAIGKSWNRDYTPKSDTARLGLKLVEKTLEIIRYYHEQNPNLIYYIENPRGMLRKLPVLKNVPYHHTVTYCQYGDDRMKPTDIWTNNPDWTPKKACKNGMACHISAPRGSRTGTQGLRGSFERSRVPTGLCLETLIAAYPANDIAITKLSLINAPTP